MNTQVLETAAQFLNRATFKLQHPRPGEPWMMEFTAQNGNKVLICDFDGEYLIEYLPDEKHVGDTPDGSQFHDLPQAQAHAQGLKDLTWKTYPF